MKSRFIKITYISVLSFLFFSFIPAKIHANCGVNPNDSIKFIIESKLHYGFIIAHHKSMQHLETGHFPAFEINLSRQTNGNKQWQHLFKYPVMGISFWYADLGNPAVLGSAFAIFPNLKFHLTQSRRFSLNFRLGVGLGYLTKKFDRLINYKNIAIGSHVNVCIDLFYELQYRLAKRLIISGGVGLTHFSNGAMKTPNLGINIPTLNVGLAYLLPTNNKIAAMPDVTMKREEKKLEIQSFLSGGMKEVYPAYGRKYAAYSLSTCFLKPLSLKRKIDAGLDFFWEFSDIKALRSDGKDVKNDLEIIRTGIHIGHQLEFSRLSFVTQVGFYVYAMNNGDGPVYMRVAFRYKLNHNLLLNLALKTHFAKADFVEFGIGYRLK